MEKVLFTDPLICGDTSIGCNGYINTHGNDAASSARALSSLTVPYTNVGLPVNVCTMASIWLRRGMGEGIELLNY